ncbi:hypothetical protein BTN45_03580 [Rhizobium sp. ZX09]|nr:hypothetical protein BTN45_03580 [Rhizobium sp. ZX09]
MDAVFQKLTVAIERAEASLSRIERRLDGLVFLSSEFSKRTLWLAALLCILSVGVNLASIYLS